MAFSPSRFARLSACALLITVYCFSASAAEAAAFHDRPQKHFMSWESASAPARAKEMREGVRSTRIFDVKRRRVVRLKRAQFLDRRPVQFSTPIVNDNMLYVGSNAGVFYGVDIKQNKKVWSRETFGGIESPAVTDGSAVYFGDVKGYGYALDAQTGEVKWVAQLGGEVLGAPLINGSRLYVVTIDGRLFALERETGKEIWFTDAMERQTGFTVRRQSTPIFYGGLIIFGTSQGTLVAYREDAKLAWRKMLGDPQAQVADVDSKPLIVGDRLYVTSADGELFCVNPHTGEIIWSVGAGGINDALYHDGMLYASGGGILYAVDPGNGSVTWEQNLETAEISSPAVGKGYAVVVSTRDKLYLIDLSNGDIVFERFIRRGSYGDPIVVDDDIYVLANSSRLFSFHAVEKK